MADIRKPNPKFPPTRLLKAGYEDIVPNGCHNEEVTISLNEVVHSAYFTTNSNTKPNNTIHPSEIQDHTLCGRTGKLKAILEQQISELNQSIQLQENVIEESLPNIRTLIRVSKIEPSLTAVTLNYCSLATPTLSRVRHCDVVQCCRCSQRALPFTTFCTKHIYRSRTQALYCCCTVIDTGTKQKCGEPVSDILSATNTCTRHYKAADVGGVASLKRGVARGGIGKGVLSSSRNKSVKIPPKKAPLPNILKAHRELPKELTPHSTVINRLSPPPRNTVIPQPSTIEAPSDSPLTPKSSLDDLLKLGPPLQSLNLPPLEADLGDFMMAEEGEGN